MLRRRFLRGAAGAAGALPLLDAARLQFHVVQREEELGIRGGPLAVPVVSRLLESNAPHGRPCPGAPRRGTPGVQERLGGADEVGDVGLPAVRDPLSPSVEPTWPPASVTASAMISLCRVRRSGKPSGSRGQQPYRSLHVGEEHRHVPDLHRVATMSLTTARVPREGVTPRGPGGRGGSR